MAQLVQAGLQILRRGKASYVGQVRLEHQKLQIHSDDGDLVVLSPDQFRREVVDGDIEMLVPAGDGTLRPVSNNWRQSQSTIATRERNRRTAILQHVKAEQEHGAPIKRIVLKLSEFCQSKELGDPPCERTLRNWRQLAKGHESMLSPAWSRCGNRFQGPDEILLEILAEVFAIAIAGSDLFTLSRAWQIVEARFDEEWRKRHGDVTPPRHSIKKLKNFLRSMPWSDLMKVRMDGRTARAMTRTAVRLHDTGTLWDCVEMDATVLDILLRDENGLEIGRPVLYVAVDVATGYVVGLHLTIQKPSVLPFVECLRFMYFPKPHDFDSKFGILNRVELFGKPVFLKVDNGSEFIGKMATEIVRHMYGDSARCQPYKPEEKPHVERCNGEIRKYILTLNGATTSSITGKKRVPLKGETLHTLDELREKLFRWVFDDYCLQANGQRSKRCRKAVAPLDIAKEMRATFTEPVPVSREEFDRSLCFKRDERKLSHCGISFDGWTYHSDELASMYLRHSAIKVEFMFSDLDATTIYVLDPGTRSLVAAFEKHLEGTSIDRETAKLVRLQISKDAKVLNSRAFAHTLREFRERTQQVKSSRGRAKQARVDDLSKSAMEHAKRSMPGVKSPPTVSTPNLPPDSNPVGAPRGRKMGKVS